jgi:Kef-type K+ transport system membrane component KefB/nucleotide-binding universal stress UspA family protein
MTELFHNPLALLLLQAVVIVPLARLLGNLCTKIHQPMVIGEIVAGLMLGPSFFGWLFPNAYAALFPDQSMQGLQLLSQVGLIFFMFLVGLEFNPKLLKGHGEAAVAVSNSSILTPFLLGTLLALYLYPKLSDDSVAFVSFALFMGAAMSVTAFPVLARILTERKLTQTKIGALALTCAAVDDVTAWLMLAFVISVVKATGIGHLLWILSLTVVYIAIMIWVIRPLLRRFEKRYSTREGLSQNAVGIIFLLLLASALTAEQIGIHALFGAFFLGAIMPNETGFVRHLSEKIEDIAVLFLLPLFFAYTGLRTQIGLLDTPELWGLAGLILLTACLGKFGGSFIAAKLKGLKWRESAAIGILMNTRGLMELVIISIGLDLGVISPALFTILVLMALITTFITSPLLHWVYPQERFHDVVEIPLEQEKPYTILVSIALLRGGGGLLKIAQALAGGGKPSRVYALHLVRSSDRPSYYVKGSDAMEEYSQLQPLLEPFRESGLDLRPLSFPTSDPGEDIVEVARAKATDLILLGWHKPILGQTILGGTVHEVMEGSRSTVAVFIDRGLKKIGRILVPYISSSHDRAALALAQRMARSLHSQVVILHVMQPQHAVEDPHASSKSFDEDFIDPETDSQVKLEVIESLSPIEAVLEESKNGYDLVIIGVSEDFDLEHRLFGLRPERIAADCPVSMLIVRQAPENGTPK